jgi:hypothetical protein
MRSLYSLRLLRVLAVRSFYSLRGPSCALSLVPEGFSCALSLFPEGS